MDNPPGSVPAQRRTTLVAFLVLLISVLVITVLMVLPYVLAVIMGGILAVLAQPVFQRLTGYHITPRAAWTRTTRLVREFYMDHFLAPVILTLPPGRTEMSEGASYLLRIPTCLVHLNGASKATAYPAAMCGNVFLLPHLSISGICPV